MVDKHAISPLNQQDKTPGQHTEDRAAQSAISRCHETCVSWRGGYGRNRYFSRVLPAFCSCRGRADAERQRLRWKPLGLCRWSSK